MAKAGFQYEIDLLNRLSALNLVPADKRDPAGADDSVPDITIMNMNGAQSGVEVKLNEGAAYGSGTLGFDYSAIAEGGRGTSDPWFVIDVNPQGEDIKEAQRMIGAMAKAVDLEEKVNDNWYWNNKVKPKYIPFQIYKGADLRRRAGYTLNETAANQKEKDLKRLPDSGKWKPTKNIPCAPRNIIDYYTAKKSYYIQIGDRGLYWFGKDDPLGLARKAPKFAPREAYFRVRVQSKGGQTYRFAFELYVKGLTRSGISLGNARGTGANYTGLETADLSFLY